MTFVNEATTSVADLLAKVNTFLGTTDGTWTVDHADAGAGKYAHSKGTTFLSWRFDTSAATLFGVYNALGFIGTGTDPGNHTDDSGNGVVSGTNATLATGRTTFADGITQWWGFTDGNNFYGVVEAVSGADTIYPVFGGGILEKVGDWTGGEFGWGYRHKTGITSGNAVSLETTMLLDGGCDFAGFEAFMATIHVEGLPNQRASKWAVCAGTHANANTGNDRAANLRNKVQGGARGGPLPAPFARFSADSEKGLIPGYPIVPWYIDVTTGDVMVLGHVKNIRGFNMEHYVAGQEIVIGGDTWLAFPSRKKTTGASTLSGESGHQGWLYKKVV